MLQFYFLSVLLNALTGFMLIFVDTDEPETVIEGKLPQVMRDETFRLILGILTCITGFFKLLTAVRGDIPVIGDLFPAFAGLIGGFTLLYDFYRRRSTVDEETLPPVVQKIVNGRKYVGISALLAAVLHFLFPTVLFL